MSPEPDDLWDSERLARYLQIPPRTLDQWSWRRVGPPFLKVGRYRRYRWSDIEAWLDQQREDPSERNRT